MLLFQEQGLEIETWGLIPLLAIGLLFLYGYDKWLRFGLRKIKSYIAETEANNNVRIVFHHRHMGVNGTIGFWRKTTIALRLFAMYVGVMFLPWIAFGIPCLLFGEWFLGLMKK